MRQEPGAGGRGEGAMRRIFLLSLLPLLLAAPARAQMPDLRTMSGRPLPVADLPVGTVVLRVVRGNLEQRRSSGWRSPPPPGRSRAKRAPARARPERTAGSPSRGCPSGGEFEATVMVDGERLDTRFVLPRAGGTRVMLIAGLGPPGAEAATEGAPGAAGAPERPSVPHGHAHRDGGPRRGSAGGNPGAATSATAPAKPSPQGGCSWRS